MNIIPGIDYGKVEKHGDPSRPDYYRKHPNIKPRRPSWRGGKRGGAPPGKRAGLSASQLEREEQDYGPSLRGIVPKKDGPKKDGGKGKAGRNGKTQAAQAARFTGTGTKEDPIETDDINVAAQALFQGKHVNFTQKKSVSVLLDELHLRVKEIEDKGEKAPDIDLCQVTVKGTNLFCIPAVVHRGKDKEGKERGARYFMPQLKAKPIPGSRADKMPKDENGEVDLQPLFREKLMEMGVKIEDGKEKASYLRPSQEYLRGKKVAGMVNSLRNFYLGREGRKMSPEGSPIFISSDDYIVDGHHRWAAIVGVDLEDNKEGDIDMDIQRIDMPISQLLRIANEFADEYGMERQEKALFPDCGQDLFFVINTVGQYDVFDSIAKAKTAYAKQLDRGGEVFLVKRRIKHKHKGKAGCT